MAPRRVVVTGATGFVGSALSPALTAAGHELRTLGRHPAGPGAFGWDPQRGEIDRRALDGADVVVHLAGANIAGRRWTDAYRRVIRDSRVAGTDLLARAILTATSPPRVLVAASAVGIYGDRGDELLDEDSPPGEGFLPRTCQDWEAAAAPARAAGLRVVHLRLGMVLGRGGALAKMLPAFRLGLGGRLGRGTQWLSWIALDDAVRLFVQAAEDPRYEGAIVAAAPAPVTNAEFTRTLARVLRRPALLAAPRSLLRLLFGRIADELLLASARARSSRLEPLGFSFRWPQLEPALRAMLLPAR